MNENAWAPLSEILDKAVMYHPWKQLEEGDELPGRVELSLLEAVDRIWWDSRSKHEPIFWPYLRVTSIRQNMGSLVNSPLRHIHLPAEV